MICVYKITNPKGKIYVGSTINWASRLRQYNLLKCKSQIKLYNSLKKYGPKSHLFEVITECSITEMRSMEATYGHFYNVLDKVSGLNCNLPKIGDVFSGVSEETRKKQSNSKKGKYSGCLNPFFNKTHTPDARSILSQKSIGNKKWLGKKHNEISKEKIRLHRKGKFLAEQNYNFGNRGESNPLSRIILNTQTGLFYFGTRETAEFFGFNRNTFAHKLGGSRKNNTDFIFV